MSRAKLFFKAALCAALACAAVDVPAAFAQSVSSASVPKVESEWPSDGDAKILNIALNQAHSIRLPVDVRDVIVANPDVADVIVKNSKLVFVLSKAVGSTVVYFLGRSGNVILKSEVRVGIDTGVIDTALQQFMPQAKINTRAHQNNIFLSGKVRTADEAANAQEIAQRFAPANVQVVNLIELLGEQQVILQVRVAEVARTVRKNLAASTPLTTEVGNLTVNAINPFGAIDFFAAGTFDILTNSETFRLGPATFRALEEQGLVKTLAEPSLTAISGETANFLAGGEFPFPAGFDNNGNVIIEFRDFGVGLNFTPVVADKGRISLQIATEISSISAANSITILGVTIPGIATRRTSTTVDLPSGGTIMLSGLLQEDGSNKIRGLPFLKDLPILGALFRSTEFAKNETELLIIVTAYLAKPADNSDKLTIPTDGFPQASDVDLYLLGRLHGEYVDSQRPRLGIPLAGPYGYIME